MPKEFDSCVEQVKGQKGVRNPFAVCRGSLGSDKDIKARRKKEKESGKPKRKA